MEPVMSQRGMDGAAAMTTISIREENLQIFHLLTVYRSLLLSYNEYLDVIFLKLQKVYFDGFMRCQVQQARTEPQNARAGLSRVEQTRLY